MAVSREKESLAKVLVHEGGYVNHRQDPGGPTNKGVTQRVYDAYRKGKGLPMRSVKHITMDEVYEIYDRQYWD
ncbi:MAG: N-acetylmuramidase, partial [Mesorhizobium sp.]